MKFLSWLTNVVTLRCPSCRKGKMFYTNSCFNWKRTLDMPEKCSHCNLKFELEPGFWWGTGYISYMLTVAFLVSTFVAYAVLIGISYKDDSILHWIIVSIILLVVVQPYIMKLARSLYLHFFIRYKKK